MPYKVFLTSSDPKDELDSIRKEFQSLSKSFSNKNVKGVVGAEIVREVTDEAIFTAYLGETDIRLFHFSGHAGEGKLLMDDGKLAHAGVLAAMMREAKFLRLVFLNGCATYDLVNKFLEAGAKLVIATKVPVYDSTAASFSISFYDGLCADGLSVGEAFTRAKLQVQKEVDARVAKLAGSADLDPASKEYQQILEGFGAGEQARHISKGKLDKTDLFQWGIYCADEGEREELEKWKLVGQEKKVQPGSKSLSFTFLKKLARLAIDIKGTINETDPRLAAFQNIEDVYQSALSWRDAPTTTMISRLQEILNRSLKKPFKKWINFAKDNRTTIQNNDIADLKDLLTFQLDFYKTFVKTSALIMLSDFMESALLAADSNSEELKGDFSDELFSRKHQLFSYFGALLSSEKGMDDIQFSIDLSRSISFFLSTARKHSSGDNKKVFRQFVEEYNVSALGKPIDSVLMDSAHQVLIRLVDKCKSGEVDEADADALRAYCDRAETGLTELFSNFKYVLKYEIITVGKVEANRRRDVQLKTLVHDVLIVEGLLPYNETVRKYEDEFTENYSVLLVTHRKRFWEYLSLSPFLVDVGPFFEQDSSIIFYFTQKSEDYLVYHHYNESGTEVLKINLAADPDVIDDIDDTTFLVLPDIVSSIVNNRDPRIQVNGRRKFAGIGNQFQCLEKLLTEFISMV